jgi:hypothetical protein
MNKHSKFSNYCLCLATVLVPLSGRFIKGFGEDAAGKVYLLSTTRLRPAGNPGDVRRLLGP